MTPERLQAEQEGLELALKFMEIGDIGATLGLYYNWRNIIRSGTDYTLWASKTFNRRDARTIVNKVVTVVGRETASVAAATGREAASAAASTSRDGAMVARPNVPVIKEVPRRYRSEGNPAGTNEQIWLRGTQRADQRLIDKVRQRGYEIEWVDEGHPSWSDWQADMVNAQFDPRTSRILLRRDARTIEVLEEYLHTLQEKLGLTTGANPKLPYPREEVHVKEFMLQHRDLLGISPEDAEVIRQMLLRQVQRSKVDVNGVPLTIPPIAEKPINTPSG